ncbi:uncharacterized protein BDZ83DRAFT_761631 [Colletotrichum acutatum]|uniref:Uncharacterized protein n=1 Tax=Glomerella acutata TaxID=27357 RepID=A0AAD8UGZ8_GLOAC|nr:uncharacterized protein BDZ83DRAFT_761631 [Colletotrichum acutatum]KAK1716091.1 hypothetical protein BDZ83DRAFT_761631 [Colletotrichum acutatum]
MRARGKGTRKESPAVWYGKVSAGKVGSREGTYNEADNMEANTSVNRQQTTEPTTHPKRKRAQVEVAVPLPSLLAPDDAAVSTDGTGLLDFWILDSGLTHAGLKVRLIPVVPRAHSVIRLRWQGTGTSCPPSVYEYALLRRAELKVLWAVSGTADEVPWSVLPHVPHLTTAHLWLQPLPQPTDGFSSCRSYLRLSSIRGGFSIPVVL